jgi:putative Holliday junction resolvase
VTRDRGRVLAIDLGEARIGLALSDPLRMIAQPLEVHRCVGPRRDLARIASLVREREVDTVVIGLPRLLSGAEGEAAAAARRFADELRGRLSGVAVELWDERLSTVEVERMLVEADVGRARRRAVRDALAAAVILQGYLDSAGGGRS